MDSITLSGNEFKALASETRVQIIKLLQERNHTLSELSQKTSLAAPTVKQHLGVLETAQLIEQVDTGRKWKYYCLTRKGKKIFSPEEPKNILIVLAVSILAFCTVIYSFLSTLLQSGLVQSGIARAPAAEPDKVLETGTAAEIHGAIAAAQQIPIPIEKIALFVALIALLALAIGFLAARAKK